MTTVHDRYADVDGQRLFYRETGPAVVLLYGFSASSFMFRDLIPCWPAGYHVITPDHLGSGLSGASPASEFTDTSDALAGLTGTCWASSGSPGPRWRTSPAMSRSSRTRSR